MASKSIGSHSLGLPPWCNTTDWILYQLTELLIDLVLHGQAMAVPAKTTDHMMARCRGVPSNNVLGGQRTDRLKVKGLLWALNFAWIPNLANIDEKKHDETNQIFSITLMVPARI